PDHQTNATPSPEECGFLIRHAAICRKLGRTNEAAADLRSLGLPARDPAAGLQLVDLSAFYSAGFNADWDSEPFGGNDLASLPTGVQVLAGTRFDVRGLVQLCSSNLMSLYPDA